MTWIDATYRCPFGYRVSMILGRAPDQMFNVPHSHREGGPPVCRGALTLMRKKLHDS